MKVSRKGQVTIPAQVRERHGLLPDAEVTLEERPEGILLVRRQKRPTGKRVIESMLQGGKLGGRTSDWLRMTRGDE